MKKKYLQWIEIDGSALIHNLHQFRALIGKQRQLLAVVKANAYGHGILEVSELALKAGVNWLGVQSIEEALLLRQNGVKSPVLVMGYIPFADLKEAVLQDVRLTVYNRETVEKLSRISQDHKKKAIIHIKIETGTYRQGIHPEEAISFIRAAQAFPGIMIEGLSSHFANIEDTTDHSYAQSQLDIFRATIQELEKNNIRIPIKHMSCSASAILFPKTYFDMVRIGLGMYGLWPSKETYLSCVLENRKPLLLRPVLSWKTRIAQLKRVPKDAFVGYGCTYRTSRDTMLAVLPVGYYDGYSRSLSNLSYVLIRGKRAPLRGRVAMDFITADVTDIAGVCLEDEAILLGRTEEEAVTADYLASIAGTINYEIVTRIGAHVPRIIVL
jgi:alanine racemase